MSQFVPTADGRLLIPELRYLTYSSATGNQWIPNDHMPLIWPQANSHLALKLFEETS